MTQTQKMFRCFFSLLLTGLFLSGCSSTPDSTHSGFLEHDSALQKGNYFKLEYMAPGAKFTDITAVKVAPINLSLLDNKTACDGDELENLGREFRENIEKELEAAGIKTTSNPVGKTLVISIALTNIEPPNAIQNVAATAAGFFVPVPLPLDSDGTTAFEGKITEGTSDKILVEFAEMQSGAGDNFDVGAMAFGGYSKFLNSKALFKGWAHNIAMMVKDLKAGNKPGTSASSKTAATAGKLIGAAADAVL